MMAARVIVSAVLISFRLLATADAADHLKVTLLGTGTPQPEIARFGPGTLVEAGGQRLLIDCGRGVTQRLWQLQMPLSSVTAVFLTHLHSDHIVGIPDLWLTGWLAPPFGHRMSAFEIWGPPGTKMMMKDLQRAYDWDIQARVALGNLSPAGIAVVAEDVHQGVVYEKNGVKVTAFDVDHGIKPALGYRIDYGTHSVVISGDTRPSENLIQFSAGTDVLIHEVAAAPVEQMRRSESARRIIGHHTTPEEAGRIFSAVKPKLAVYSHIALLTTEPNVPAPGVMDLLKATRKTYGGPLEVGEDLMSIDIGRIAIVHRFAARKHQADLAPSTKR